MKQVLSYFPVTNSSERACEVAKKSVAANQTGLSIQQLFKIPAGKIVSVRLRVFAQDTSTNRAYFEVIATAANKSGTVALVGSATVVAGHKDVSGWAATLVANNTAKTVDLSVTSDTTNATTFQGIAIATLN